VVGLKLGRKPSSPAGVVDEFPIITAHFSISTDLEKSFVDIGLETFLSPAKDNAADPRQRVLGDYMELKALGKYILRWFHWERRPIWARHFQQ